MRDVASAAEAVAAASDEARGEPAMMEEAAFHALYRRTAAPLRAYAARVLGDVTRADDIVQEAYLRLLRRPLPSDDADEQRAYLFRIASNLIADDFRRRRHETTVAAMPERPSAGRDVSLRIDMQRTFHALRPRDRQLLWLAHVEEADHRAIASALGIGERSVRVLLYRARQKLLALIRGYEKRGGDR